MGLEGGEGGGEGPIFVDYIAKVCIYGRTLKEGSKILAPRFWPSWSNWTPTIKEWVDLSNLQEQVG
jgi:hypothetical protein